MIPEIDTKPSPQLHADSILTGNEDTKAAVIATPDLPKEAKQQYLINEIKKLVEGCEDFIGLVPGPGGVPEVVVSPNLKKHKWTIMGDAQATFTEFLSMRSPSEKGNSCSLPQQYVKAIKQEPTVDARAPGGSISLPVQRPLKRHRSRTGASRDSLNPRPRHGGGGTRVVESPARQIRADDCKALAEWYKSAFVRLQQVACRLVAKVWIKKIHPKKQSTHPYNGQMPRNTAPDSNRTRPPYWPIDVQHREPDHIGRDERTRLLVHLVMNTPQPVVTNPPADPSDQQFVYARDLLECLEPKRGERELTEERWETIQQIIKARAMEEQYAAGEIDGDTLIFLCNYSGADGSTQRAINSDDDEFEPDGNAPGVVSEGSEAADEDRELTPDSSTQTSATDQSNIDGPVSISRARSSADSLAFQGRRIAACRSRPSVSGGPATPAITIRTGPSFVPELTMGMESGMAHRDAAMLSLVGMPQQVAPHMFGPMENHTGTSEMMKVAAHSGHPAANLHMSAWSRIMPDMGPDPTPEMFGIPPTMTPTSMRHAYFGQEVLEMAGEMQSGMHPTILSPAQYQDFLNSARRALPFRAAEPQHPTMMPTQDVSMEMMPGHFY